MATATVTRESLPPVVEPTVGKPPRDRLSLAAVGLALLPLLSAAIRAISSGWVPVGDTAVIAVRTRDVFGGGPFPLIGTWSGKSWAAGFHMHHPGPMFFDLLAVPTALLPGSSGMVVGTTLINAAAILGIFLVARRRGGQLLGLGAMAVATALTWSMGSAVLAEPWNVGALLLAFFLYCMLAWSVADRDYACLPWMVVVGSYVLQSNLAFALLVPGLLAFALVVPWLRSKLPRSSRYTPPDRRNLVLAGIVGLLCWAQPLIEQAISDNYGNMTRLARGSIKPTPTLDTPSGVELVAKIVAIPPFWGRPSYADAFPFTAFGNPLPSLVASVVALAVVAAVMTWGWWAARQRDDRSMVMLLATAACLLVLGLVTAQQTPTNGPYGTTAYQVRWLWPTGAFVTFALLASLLRSKALANLVVPKVTLVGAVGLLAVLNLPASNEGTTAPESTQPVASEILAQLDAHELSGTVLVECAERLFDPYCEAVLAELRRTDVDFVMQDMVGLRQVGLGREWTGDNATARLTVATGDRTLAPPRRSEQIASHVSLDEAGKAELDALQAEFHTAATTGSLHLNERGKQVAGRGDLHSVSQAAHGFQIDPDRLIGHREDLFGEHSRDLVAMQRQDLLTVDKDTAERLERYADLQERWDHQTVAIFLEEESL